MSAPHLNRAWAVRGATLVRLQIEKVADDAGVEPTQISFAGALRLVCDTWLWCSLPGAALG